MVVFGPVVQPFMLPVFSTGHDCPRCRRVAGQLVRDHDPRRPALPLQQLAHQPFGGGRIPAALDQDIQHLPMLIDRAPRPVSLAGNGDRDLVQVPLSPGLGSRWQI